MKLRRNLHPSGHTTSEMNGSACLDCCLYMSHREVWKESSRAPCMASSSAHSLPAAVMRHVPSSLACSELDRCACHFVTESMWASSPMSRKRARIRRHTSACGLRPAGYHSWPRSKPRNTAAHESCSRLRQDDCLQQGPELCPHDAALQWERDCYGTVRRANHLVRGFVDLRHCPSSLSTLRSMFAHQASVYKQLAPKNAAHDNVMYPHMNCAIVCPGVYFSTGSCIKPFSHLSLSSVAVSL